MENISKELMEKMFAGNQLRCVCDTIDDVNNTYDAARLFRREISVDSPERIYCVSKEWGACGGVVTVLRMED